MGQTGSGPWSHTHHPKHEPPAPAAAAESCPHHTGAGTIPQSWQCLVLMDTAHSCPALPTPSLLSSSQSSLTRSTRYKPSMHSSHRAHQPPRCSVRHPRRWGLREETDRRERALQEGKQPWNRGARREPELSRAGPGRAVCPEVHKCHSHHEPKSQRSREGERAQQVPTWASLWPPEQPLVKEAAVQSLQLPGPLQVLSPALLCCPDRGQPCRLWVHSCLAHRERYD